MEFKRTNTLYHLLIITTLTLTACAPSQTASRSASEDLALLAEVVDRIHPAPNRYASAADRDAVFRKEVEGLAGLEGRALSGGYSPDLQLRVGRAVHRMMAQLGDFHVQVSLPLYGDTTAPLSLLPLYVLPVEEGWAVDAAPGEWPPGTLVESINGMSVEALQAELLPLVAADGRDKQAALASLAADLPRFFALRYGMLEHYELVLLHPDGKREQVTLAAAGREAIGELRRARHGDRLHGVSGSPEPTLERFEYAGKQTAHLRLPSFGVGDMAAYRALVGGLMGQLGGVELLLVDVRGNLGGLRPNGFGVLDVLLDQPYPQWTHFETVVLELPDDYGESLKAVYPNDIGQMMQTTEGPPYVRHGEPQLENMHPELGRFEGRVAVLSDGLSNSAANTFLLALENYSDAVHVGSPPGGACDEHVGQYPVVFVLPHSKVAVQLSIVRIHHVAPDRCEPGRGLSPDVAVLPSVRDLVEGRDATRDAALEALTRP